MAERNDVPAGLTDYMQNVSDVIARKREITSSKISVVATCLYTVS